MVKLSSYKGNNVLEGTQDLFNSLGLYINTPSDTSLPIEGILPDAPQSVKKLFDKISETYFVGTIDDKTLQGKDDALSFKEEVANITEHYKGMMVFAVDIIEGETINRGEIASLNRAFNRASKAAPVALIVRYGKYLSFSICERTAYVQSGHTGEKPGKVSLLRDINIEDPHSGHIEILNDMAAKGSSTFDDLYEKWLKVFDNDILTDRFYVELQNWYFWALKTASFANDINDETDGKKYNPETVIRLITRLVFVWFLKQKGLVPPEIFEKDKLQNILKDFQPESETSSQYYRAILQNLFFATLNKKIGERGFAFDEGWTKNRSNNDVRNLYRFEKDFVWWNSDNPSESRHAVNEQVQKLFSHVPYMNNSLFECLDNKGLEGKTYYWDGFSRNKKYQAKVPNKLFFVKEEIVDLTDSYLDLSEKQKESDLKKYRAVRVHGLLDILNRYHFTIEENTPLDVDVALDPELLGKAFEQLLAAFNPETQKTVRKATGSYYTPRPIVQYMVDESIVAYLNRTVPSVPEETVRLMLGYGQDIDINLTDEQRQSLVEAVFNCRILDPACGSGAFPMGILQQLSHLLSRIDTNNKYWEEIVLARAMEDIKKASHLDEENEAATKADIQEAFNMSVAFPDYARKLYLIEKCIYGVDIQSIAVQISRLRFFISLLCEQKPTDDEEDNFGVRPLPNLEMKFVTANTLVKLKDAEQAHLLFEDKKISKLIDELSQVRHNLFAATKASSRKRYLERDKYLREQIALLSADNFADERNQKIKELERLQKEAESKLQFAKENLQDKIIKIEEKDIFGEVISIREESSRERKLLELSSHVNTIRNEIKKLRETAETGRESILALARQLTDWNPYDQNVSSPFFDSKWMFNINDSFDIVIGNPPYVIISSENPLKSTFENLYDVAKGGGKRNLFHLFFEKGLNSLVKGGVLSFITPDTFLAGNDTLKLRNYFINHSKIRELKLYSEKDRVFKGVTQAVAVSRIISDSPFVDFSIVISGEKKTIKSEEVLNDDKKRFRWNNTAISKINRIKTKVSDFFDGNKGDVNLGTKKNHFFKSKKPNSLPLARGVQIGAYSFSSTEEWCELTALSKNVTNTRRIIFQEVSNAGLERRVKATIQQGLILGDSINYLIPKIDMSLEAALGVVNSKVVNYYFKFYNQTNHVPIGDFKAIPFPVLNSQIQEQLASIVNIILIEKSKDLNSNVLDLENQIDFLVYKLYGLNYDEVCIIDPEPPFTREEYDNFKLD